MYISRVLKKRIIALLFIIVCGFSGTNSLAFGYFDNNILNYYLDIDGMMMNGTRHEGVMGSSFTIPSGFQDVSPAVTAAGYSYEFYNYDLQMSISFSEVAMASLPADLNSDYNYYKNFYSNEGYEIVYDVKFDHQYVLSGFNYYDNSVFYINSVVNNEDIYMSLNAGYPNDDLKSDRDELLNRVAQSWTTDVDVPSETFEQISFSEISPLIRGIWGSSSMNDIHNTFYAEFSDEKVKYYNYTEAGLEEYAEYKITDVEKNDDEKICRIYLENGIYYEADEYDGKSKIETFICCWVKDGEVQYSYSDSIYKLEDDLEFPGLEEEKININTDILLRSGTYNLDFSEDMFNSVNTLYNYDIAKFAVILSEAAYDDSFEKKEGKYIYAAYKTLGFSENDICLYNYTNSSYNNSNLTFINSDLAFSIASRKLGDKTLLVVDFRNSETLEKWSEDLFLGSDDKLFLNTESWDKFYGFWEDYNTAMTDYYESHPDLKTADNEGKLVVLVTGHSLGAAAANMVGKSLNDKQGIFKNLSFDDIYVYTFGCPRVAKEAADERNIFNIVNKYDIVPCTPIQYDRYGNTYIFEDYNVSVSDNNSCTTYLDAVVNYNVSAASAPLLNNEYRVFYVWSPTDVEILKNDNVVAKVVNDDIELCEDNISIDVENGHKIIVLPDNDDYTVKLDAYDDGQMNLYLMACDGDNEYMKSYTAIKIKKGEKFVANISAPQKIDKTQLVFKEKNKDVILSEDNEEGTAGKKFEDIRKNSKKDFIKKIIIIAVIVFSVIFLVVIIIVAVVIHNKKKSNMDINFKQNTMKSKDNIHTNDINTIDTGYFNRPQDILVQDNMYQDSMNSDNINSFNAYQDSMSQGDNIINNKIIQNGLSRDYNVFCVNCGNSMTTDQRFCKVCGCENKYYNGL